MIYLIDTHIFLWWVTDISKLSTKVREILEDSETTILFSAASAWEIITKNQVGKLDLPGPCDEYIESRMSFYGIFPLAITMSHSLKLATLPMLHRDPFDRILIAQALAEGAHLVTADAQIAQYDVPVIW